MKWRRKNCDFEPLKGRSAVGGPPAKLHESCQRATRSQARSMGPVLTGFRDA